MASFNTFSDSSNTAVRAFLTKVGAFYNNGRKFDTTNGVGKEIWETIKKDFNNSCCYCGKREEKLTMEHLIMMNRSEYGLHHPGNVAPCCRKCNKRLKNKHKKYLDWRSHLKAVSTSGSSRRLKAIENHIEKYKYPKLTEKEIKTIKVIAESLYSNIGNEGEKAFNLYKELRKEFLS